MHSVPTRFFGEKDDSKALLSVVVPIGRMAGQLENLLSWILDIQGYPSQVILVVDEKGDGTYRELIDELEQRAIYQPLIVMNAICNGPGLARNLGSREATGKWITYWDSDDKPNVKETFNAIRDSQENTDVIICRYEILSNQQKISSPKLSQLRIALNPGIWRFIFLREKFLESAFPNLRLAEDQVFLIKSKVFSKNIALHNRASYLYIQGGVNQLTKTKGNVSDLLEAIDILSEPNMNLHSGPKQEKKFLFVVINRLILTSTRKNPLKTLNHLMANPRIVINLFKLLLLLIFSWLAT